MRNLAVAVSTLWTTEEAIELAKKVEAICPLFGYHVALTGGLLYKEGPRKDCDLILYRSGSMPTEEAYDYKGLLQELGTKVVDLTTPIDNEGCRVWKAVYNSKSIDLIFPEFWEDNY